MQVPNNEFLSAALAVLKTQILGSTPTTPKVKLFKAPASFTPNTDPATLTEADFTGYAAQSITAWAPEHVSPQGFYIVNSSSAILFEPSGTTVLNTIYGYWIEDSQGNCVAIENFPNPIVLTGPGTPIQFVPGVGIGPWQLTVVPLP